VPRAGDLSSTTVAVSLTYNENKGELAVGGCSKNPVWYQDFFQAIAIN
jgi:hypothetical protein